MDIWVTRAKRDLKAIRDKLVNKVQQVQKDQKELKDSLVKWVTQEVLVPWESQDPLDYRDRRVLLEVQEQWEMMETRVMLEFPEIVVTLVRQVQQVHKVLLA
jgi:hypothetical protein